MHPLLKKLNFVPLETFIKDNLGIHCPADCVYIRCEVSIPCYRTDRLISNIDILSRSLDLVGKTNQLGNGYSKTTRKWFTTNTTRNIFRTSKWNEIFNAIGDDYSIFILTKCSILEESSDNLIFMCGEFDHLIEKKENKKIIDRGRLFIEKGVLQPICHVDLLNEMCGDIPNHNKLKEHISRILALMSIKYNRIPLKKTYKSYFHSSEKNINVGADSYESKGPLNNDLHANIPKDNDAGLEPTNSIMNEQIDPERIINFLFAISKKFLKPVFRYSDFKVLKGKLSLLIKRNMHENLSIEEIKKYFSITKLKFFNGAGKANNHGIQSRIVTKFLLFLFNTVYMNILTFFFYSTHSSDTRYKIWYFSRVDWNRKISIFLREHLQRFEKTKGRQRIGTLRCLPKEDGFRVITNCSKKSNMINNGSDKQKVGHASLNSHLLKFLPVLRAAGTDLLKDSLFGYPDIQRKLHEYLGKATGRQYILKLDISKCFDSIPHKELLEVIDELLNMEVVTTPLSIGCYATIQ